MEETGLVKYLNDLAVGKGFLPEWYFGFGDKVTIISLIVILIAIIGVAILFVKGRGIMRAERAKLDDPYGNPTTEEEAQEMYTDDWQQIKQFVNSFQEAEWKLAVIQADKLVDEVLKVNGYIGESMGERLMSIDPSGFVSLQDLWEAHKLRNIIVHDMNQSVSQAQALRAIESYEKFLREIGFLIS